MYTKHVNKTQYVHTHTCMGHNCQKAIYALLFNLRSIKALYRSAMALYKMGLPARLDEAKTMLDRAAGLDPKSSEVFGGVEMGAI
jgi:hypothetical protein